MANQKIYLLKHRRRRTLPIMLGNDYLKKWNVQRRQGVPGIAKRSPEYIKTKMKGGKGGLSPFLLPVNGPASATLRPGGMENLWPTQV